VYCWDVANDGFIVHMVGQEENKAVSVILMALKV
jgi:hypothetical protein